MILGLLPLLSLLFITILVVDLRPEWEWRKGFLRASILTGVYAIMTLELLSLFESVNRITLIVVWALPVILVITILIKKHSSLAIIKLPHRVFLSSVESYTPRVVYSFDYRIRCTYRQN